MTTWQSASVAFLAASRRPQDLPAFCAAFTEVFGTYL